MPITKNKFETQSVKEAVVIVREIVMCVFSYKRSTLPKEVNETSVDVTRLVVGREVVVTKEQQTNNNYTRIE